FGAADRASRGPARRRLHPRPTPRARAQPVRPLARRRGTPRRRELRRPVIELPIRRLRDDAVLPERAYPGDAGLDLVSCERHVIGPGHRAVVGTGLAVAIPDGHAGLVLPRSGLASRHGIGIPNAPGLAES